ncbi:MAG: ATP-binding protein [Planctomycetota bacterium]|nr:ATP-binding protein [Planctomycetota bacterium]
MDEQTTEQHNREHKRETVAAELVAGLAHTVQTPLQSIMINSEMLLELVRSVEDERIRTKGMRMLNRIYRETKSLQSIVKDFMALARISVGDKQPTDINYLIQEVVEFVRNECLEHGVDITLSLDGAVYPVRVDRALFSHALMNLVKNSLEAIGEDGLIEISTREVDDYLEVEVRDDGEGVSHENEKKIFDPFFSCKPSGTGLGLSIAKRIAAMHGGDLFLRPESSHGAVFVMRLPRGKFIGNPEDAQREGDS